MQHVAIGLVSFEAPAFRVDFLNFSFRYTDSRHRTSLTSFPLLLMGLCSAQYMVVSIGTMVGGCCVALRTMKILKGTAVFQFEVLSKNTVPCGPPTL